MHVAAGYERVAEAFERNAESGAACAVVVGGEIVVDLWAGVRQAGGSEPWTARTLGRLESAGKAMTALAAAVLVARGDLDVDAPVARYWPEFASGGKGELPVRWLLSHQAGLLRGTRPITLDDMEAWHPAVEVLAAQAPLFDPGSGAAYHAATFGLLVGEVVRRIDGRIPARFVVEEIAAPLGLYLHVALPADREADLASLAPASPMTDEMRAVVRTLVHEPDRALQREAARAIDITPEDHASHRNRAAGWPSGGFATARSLATMFAACLPSFGSRRLIDDRTLELVRTPQFTGRDLADGVEVSWGLGLQLHSPTSRMSGPGSFGHAGYGGALGFADPARDLAFGYVTNRAWPGAGGVLDPRSRALIDAATTAAAEARPGGG